MPTGIEIAEMTNPIVTRPPLVSRIHAPLPRKARTCVEGRTTRRAGTSGITAKRLVAIPSSMVAILLTYVRTKSKQALKEQSCDHQIYNLLQIKSLNLDFLFPDVIMNDAKFYVVVSIFL